MKKVLYLEVRSGLCNRLRSLVSGICLSEELQCSLFVYWPSFKVESAAAFDSLYRLSSLPHWVIVIDAVSPQKKIRCDTKEEAQQAFINGLTIISNAHFHKTDTKRFNRHIRNLLPIQKILSRVNNNLNRVPLGYMPIGVHIRRTDNIKAIEESPLSGFVQAMQKIKDGYFFLATDDRAIASVLKKKFTGRLHCHETIRRRDTLEGMQEAMVSLYTLAGCSFILGCNGSSFSGQAATIGNKKIKRVGYG